MCLSLFSPYSLDYRAAWNVTWFDLTACATHCTFLPAICLFLELMYSLIHTYTTHRPRIRCYDNRKVGAIPTTPFFLLTEAQVSNFHLQVTFVQPSNLSPHDSSTNSCAALFPGINIKYTFRLLSVANEAVISVMESVKCKMSINYNTDESVFKEPALMIEMSRTL